MTRNSPTTLWDGTGRTAVEHRLLPSLFLSSVQLTLLLFRWHRCAAIDMLTLRIFPTLPPIPHRIRLACHQSDCPS